MSMLEAECTRCKETFVPHQVSVEDLIHGETLDGRDCGGIGVILGEWLVPGEDSTNQLHAQMIRAGIEAMEQHGWENPMCMDPDCEFHHPEVREV